MSFLKIRALYSRHCHLNKQHYTAAGALARYSRVMESGTKGLINTRPGKLLPELQCSLVTQRGLLSNIKCSVFKSDSFYCPHQLSCVWRNYDIPLSQLRALSWCSRKVIRVTIRLLPTRFELLVIVVEQCFLTFFGFVHPYHKLVHFHLPYF